MALHADFLYLPVPSSVLSVDHCDWCGADTPKKDQKPTVIITGASSGLGLAAAKALADAGQWHVIMVRSSTHTRHYGSVHVSFHQILMPMHLRGIILKRHYSTPAL